MKLKYAYWRFKRAPMSVFLQRVIVYYLEHPACTYLCPLIKSDDFPGKEDQRLWLYGRILNKLAKDNVITGEPWFDLTSMGFKVKADEVVRCNYTGYYEKEARVNFLLELFYDRMSREEEREWRIVMAAAEREEAARAHTPRTIREMIFGVKARKETVSVPDPAPPLEVILPSEDPYDQFRDHMQANPFTPLQKTVPQGTSNA